MPQSESILVIDYSLSTFGRLTAKSFFVAATFLEVLAVFGPIEASVSNQTSLIINLIDQIQEKIKYAKFKSVDILKAIKEGRTPTPGLGEEEPPKIEAQESHSPGAAPESSASTRSAELPPVQGLTVHDFPSVRRSAPKLTEEQPEEDEGPSAVEQMFQVNFKTVNDAQKYAKYAISSLQYDDIPAAVDNLEKALALLRPLNKK